MTEPYAVLGFWEGRRYADAVVNALETVGHAPCERWEEAAGTAFWWTDGAPGLSRATWANGLILFWRRDGGWLCTPLDSEENPDRSARVPLPFHAVANPASLAVAVPLLLRHGIGGLSPIREPWAELDTLASGRRGTVRGEPTTRNDDNPRQSRSSSEG